MLEVKIGRRIYPHYDVIINKPLFTSTEDFDRCAYVCVCVYQSIVFVFVFLYLLVYMYLFIIPVSFPMHNTHL